MVSYECRGLSFYSPLSTHNFLLTTNPGYAIASKHVFSPPGPSSLMGGWLHKLLTQTPVWLAFSSIFMTGRVQNAQALYGQASRAISTG